MPQAMWSLVGLAALTTFGDSGQLPGVVALVQQ